MIEQKIIVENSFRDFEKKVNENLREGSWIVVPNTHIARWENVCCSTGSGFGSSIKSEEGYFAIVLQRQEIEMPSDLMSDEKIEEADISRIW